MGEEEFGNLHCPFGNERNAEEVVTRGYCSFIRGKCFFCRHFLLMRSSRFLRAAPLKWAVNFLRGDRMRYGS